MSRGVMSAAVTAAILTFSPVGAQQATGSIECRVVSGGIAVAGATVTATGAALPGSRSATSDSRGLVRLVSLPVGSYVVRIVHVGHRPVTLQGVTVGLGRVSSLGEIHLETTTTASLPEILIMADHPLIDPTDISLDANIPSRTFTALPTARSFRDIVTLAPMVNASALPGDGPNIAGGSGPETAWFIDGVNMTDVLSGATSADLPYNFVREVQVRDGGYEAEFGRTMGAAVNVVTQSGGNSWHGQVFGFFTDDHLTALPRLEGSSTSRAAFRQYDIGGALGGPLIHDRLWIYAAYDPTTYRQTATVSGLAAPPSTRASHLLAAKLTWRPTSGSNLRLTVLGDPTRGRDLGQAQPFDSVENLNAVLASTRRGGVALSLAGSQDLGRRVHIEAGVATLTRTDEVAPGTPLGGAEPVYIDLMTSRIAGGYGNDSRDDARRTTGRVAVTATMGGHTTKVGIEYEDNRLHDVSAQNIVVRYDTDLWEWWRFGRSGTLHNRVPTAYLQDTWRVTPRLTVNAGVRWEGQTLAGADSVPSLRIMDEWQPRVGFVYQAGTLGTQRIYGSLGRFYEQLPLNLSVVYQNPAWYSDVFYAQDPRIDSAGGQPRVAFPPLAPPRRDLKGQAFDQASIGYERLFGRGVRLAVQATVRKLAWALDDAIDVGPPPYQVVGNPGRGDLSFTPRAERRYTGLTVTLDRPYGARGRWQVSYTLSRAYGNYEGLYDFQGAAPSANTGSVFDIPETFARSTGLLGNDRTHSLKANGSYRFGAGLTVGMSGSVTSGVPRNEFGATPPPGFYYVFLRARGSNGRAPTLTDLNLRLAYAIPAGRASRLKPTLLLDGFHLFNRRTPAMIDDTHYGCTDASGNQACANPSYGQGKFFQPPRSVRLGLVVAF